MENIKKKRRGFSVFTLIFFVSMLLFENAIFTFGVENLSTPAQFIFSYEKSEVSMGENLNISIDVDGIDEYINSIEVSYRSLTNETYKLYTWFYQNADAGFESGRYIGAEIVSGDYVIDSIRYYTENDSIIIYNERFYPDEVNKSVFSEQEFRVSGTYGGLKPLYNLSIPDIDLLPDEKLIFEMTVDSSMFGSSFKEISLSYNRKTYKLGLVEDNKYRYEGTVLPYDDPGTYELMEIMFINENYTISIYDELYSHGLLTDDLSVYDFNISETNYDYEAPVLSSVELLGHVITPERSEKIIVYAEDDFSGIAEGTLGFMKLDSAGAYNSSFEVPLILEGNQLVGYAEIDLFISSGRYVLSNVTISDQAGNTNYYDAVNNPEYINPDIHYMDVYGTTNNYQPIKTLTISSSEASPTQEIQFEIYVDEEYMQYDSATINYKYDDYYYKEIELEKIAVGHYQGSFTPNRSDHAGTYELEYITLNKIYNNEYTELRVYNSSLFPDNNNLMDLSHGNFIVKGTVGGVVPEIILTTDKETYAASDVVEVELEMLTEVFNPQEIDLRLIHAENENQSFYFTLTYDANLKKYTGTVENIKYALSGNYDVEYIAFELEDEHFYFPNSKYNDYTNSMEFKNPLFELQGTLGGMPLEYNIETVMEVYDVDDTVEIRFSFLNEFIRPGMVSLSFKNIEDSTYGFYIDVNYDENLDAYIGSNSWLNHYKPGKYELDHISFNDGGSYIGYHNSNTNESDFEFQTDGPLFEITNALWGYQPEVTISTSLKDASTGDVITVTVKTPTDVIDYTGGSIRYMVDGEHRIYKSLNRVSPGVYRFDHKVGIYDRPGFYGVESLYLYGEGHGIDIYNESYDFENKADLTGGEFSIRDTILDENPPTLINIVLPEEVYTGASFIVEVEAEDDLSGIEEGALHIYAPSGEYTRYIPLEIVDGKILGEFNNVNEEGVWQVHSLDLRDKAGNEVTYWNENSKYEPNQAVPMNLGELKVIAKKRVISSVDVKIDKDIYGPKENVELSVRILDEEKYNHISLSFLNPSGQEITVEGVENEDGTFSAEYLIESYYESGKYQLHNIRAYSNGLTAEIIHGNPAEYGYGDLSAGDFVVEGTVPDEVAPVFENLFFRKASMIAHEEQTITVVAKDESSGVESGTVTLKHNESDATITIYLDSASDGVLKGNSYLYNYMPSGKYTVSEVILTDKMNNTNVYYDKNLEGDSSAIAYDFSKYYFSIVGNIIDSEAPEFISLTMDKNTVSANEKVTYTLDSRDNLASDVNVMIEYSNDDGREFNIYHNFLETPTDLVFTKKISELYGISAGVYRADSIHLTDGAGNRTIIKRPGADVSYEADSVKEMDLSHLNLEITQPRVEDNSKYFTSITFDREIIKVNEKAKITLTPGIELVNATRITLFYGMYGRYVILSKDTAGNFTGEIELSEGYEGSEMVLTKLRAIFAGRYVDIGDSRYQEEVLLTDLSTGDYKVEEIVREVMKPVFKNFTVTEGDYTAGDTIPMNILVDNLGVDSWIEVRFRVDGEISNERLSIYQDSIRYRIGAYDPSGVYTVDTVHIYSRTGNSIIKNKEYYQTDLNAVAINAKFFVSGTKEDYIAPEFKNIIVDKKTASIGEVVTYTIDAIDKESGIEYALIYLEAPNGREYDSTVVLHPNAMGQLQGTFKIESHHVSGVWKPSQVQLIDNKGNRNYLGNSMSSSRSWGRMVNMEAAHVEVVTDEKQDIKPPVFNGFTYLNVNGNKLIELDATDDVSGINQIMLRYAAGDTILTIHGNVFSYNGKYYAELPEINNRKEKTLYLTEVRLTDYAGNAVKYIHGTSKDEAYTMNMSFGTITAENADTKKLIESITIDKNSGTFGEEITMRLTLGEALTENNYFYASLSNGGDFSLHAYFWKVSDKEYEATIHIDQYVENGLYLLDSITLESENRYYRVGDLSINYNLDDVDEYMDFSDIFLTVSGGIAQRSELLIRDVRIIREENGLNGIVNSISSLFGLDTPTYVPGDLVTVQVEVDDSDSDLSHMYLEYTNKFKIWSYHYLPLTKISDGIYQTQLRIHDFIYPGKWNIDIIQVFNEDGDGFYESSHDWMDDSYKLDGYENLNFIVENENADYTGPVVESVMVESNQVLRGETIKYRVKANDDLSGIKSMNILVKGTFTGKEIYIELMEASEGIFEGELETETLDEDVWRVKLIEMDDHAFNGSFYVNKNYYADPSYSRINMDGADVNLMTVKEITIKSSPGKLTYFTGEKLDLTGLVVAATLNDDTERILTEIEYSVSGFDSSKAMTNQVITVTYGSFTETFNVNIIANELASIEITTLPVKKVYFVGEELDMTGMEVTGTYKDGSKAILDVTKNNVTGFNSTMASKGQMLTVTISGKSTTFSVDILEKVLVDITLVTQPQKLSYNVGETIDLTGLVLLGKYNDGSSINIPLSDVMVTGFDSSKAAAGQIVTLSVFTWEFEVKVDIVGSTEHGVEVLAGSNRYRTAVAISQASYAQADTVILVQANNFPDALAAGPLAYMMDAPILLTSTASLSSTVKEELQRLEAKKVIIMGGVGAVSADVEEALIAEGYTVERLKGSNRYSTAVETAKYMQGELGNIDTVVMASGIQFADALAAGSYAAKEGYPILLTDGKKLTNATMEHITGSGVRNIILVGGTGVISEAMENQLNAMGISITRKSGKNRFDTSIEITRSYFENAETAVVANGMNFADALAAAPYAAKMNAPIILVNQTRINLPIKEYLPTSMIRKIIVVGGDAAVNEAVRNELKELIR